MVEQFLDVRKTLRNLILKEDLRQSHCKRLCTELRSHFRIYTRRLITYAIVEILLFYTLPDFILKMTN
jgi:hypothetical protein